MARRAEEARRRRAVRTALASVVAVVVVLGIGGLALSQLGLFSNRTAATPKASASPQCTYSPSPAGGTPARKVSLPPANGVPTSGTAHLTLHTNRGDISLALNQAGTPCTTHNLISLAKQKFFDGTTCHRLSLQDPYVLQCGDPTGTGGGGPGYTFPDENLASIGGPDPSNRKLYTYPVGTVAMANSGANTNGSQFFLVYKNSPLSPNYTLFGRVESGLKVIDSVAAKGVAGGGKDGKPKESVTITSVTVGKTTAGSTPLPSGSATAVPTTSPTAAAPSASPTKKASPTKTPAKQTPAKKASPKK